MKHISKYLFFQKQCCNQAPFTSIFSFKERNETHFEVCNSTDFLGDICSKGCINDINICDGIANCENGEDENYERCLSNGTFSPLATVKCNRKDLFNVNITMMAVKCDGNIECDSGEDEANCSLPDEVSIYTFVVIVFLSIPVAFNIWVSTVWNLKRLTIEVKPINQEEFAKLHGSDELKIRMHQAQCSSNSKLINETLIKMEMEQHNGKYNETICCIKNSLDSITLAKVLRDSPLKKKSKSIFSLPKRIKQVTYYSTIKDIIENEVIINMTISAVSHIMDLAKDSLILIEIWFSQGGMLLTQSTLYVRGTFFLMFGSIVVPLFLNITRFYLQTPMYLLGRNRWTRLVKFILFPIFPVFLKLKEIALIHAANQCYEISLHKLEETKYHVAKFLQGDLGLESHFQIWIHIVLLLLVTSETRTEIGLEVLFKDEVLFYLPTNLALSLSITWSLYTCISCHIRGVSKRRSYSSTKFKIVLLIYTTSSIALRVFTNILYLTPGLGLFHILRHLQGEMYPFYQPYKGYVNTEDTFYFGEAEPIPWSKISRWNYMGVENAEPPEQQLYTLVSSYTYGYLMLGIFCVHILLNMILKKLTNPKVFEKMGWIDCLIHGASCCFIPCPMEEWDEGKGTIEMHKSRKHLVFKEMLASMMLNFAINLMLLTPLIILSINIFERHDLLLNTIGTFPEENQAFLHIKLMLALGYSLLVLMTMVQVVSYYYCNGRFHPFATIVMPEEYKYTQSLGTLESSTEC